MLLLAGVLPGAAEAQPIVWRFGYVNAVGSSYVAMANTLPDIISKATNGRLKIELYDTLVPGPDQPAAVRDGRLDGTIAVNPWLSAEAPLLNIGALPGLITTLAQYGKVLDPLLRGQYEAIWQQQFNARMLATGVFEEQCILSNKPLTKASDFRGIKIRVHNTEAATLMNALGARPTPVNFPEIEPALQRGVVNAVMTSVGTAYGLGFYTVAKYVSIWKIGTIVTWSVIVNQYVWKKLPDDLKPAVAAAFRKIEDHWFAEDAPFSAAAIKALQAKGMTLLTPAPSEIAAVFSPKNVREVYDNWYRLNDQTHEDGRAVVAKVRAMLGEK
jgi:TRAP-type C4-dicarboxylate transport system substrate-binding protein